jgi:hypothetical protein
MATLIREAFIAIEPPVQINRHTVVIGYDNHLKVAVLDRGDGPVALTDVERGAWDAGEEAFTPAETAKIQAAVADVIR